MLRSAKRTIAELKSQHMLGVESEEEVLAQEARSTYLTLVLLLRGQRRFPHV